MSEVLKPEELRDAAAAPSLQRIRRDRARLDEPLRSVLAVLERSLFDPGIDARQLFRRAGVRDHGPAMDLRRALRVTPRQYIEDRRLETACRLLAETALPVSEIASLLGYSDHPTFSRAFHRWAGTTAMTFRLRERTVRKFDPAAPDDLLVLRAALLGEAEPDEAEGMVLQLVEHYPEVRDVLVPRLACCGGE